jgi:NAD(P) transhydrogenase subunit alpha
MANGDLRPTIGVLAEHFSGERRVAHVPADVRRLTKLATVTVERSAGAEAGHRDEAYIDASATSVDRLAIVSSARVILGVRAPSDLSSFQPGTVVVSLGGRDENVARTVSARALKHLGLERLPRTARAQAMDVLSSQATIAGYAAVIEGARALDVLLPMLTTAAGGIKPAKMIALGAGVAGLQAIATARRLGAVVHGFDVREAAREQVESLGARRLTRRSPEGAASGERLRRRSVRQRAGRAATRPCADLGADAAHRDECPDSRPPRTSPDRRRNSCRPRAWHGDRRPRCRDRRQHQPYQVRETVTAGGVRIVGSVNLASQMAADASRLFSGNVRALLEYLIPDETGLQLRLDDPIAAALLGVDQTLRIAA